jgi:hypothetical protein
LQDRRCDPRQNRGPIGLPRGERLQRSYSYYFVIQWQDGVLETATVLLQKPFSLKKLLDAVQRLDVTTGS